MLCYVCVMLCVLMCSCCGLFVVKIALYVEYAFLFLLHVSDNQVLCKLP